MVFGGFFNCQTIGDLTFAVQYQMSRSGARDAQNDRVLLRDGCD